MPATSSQILALTITLSTILLFLFGVIIVRYIFLYQQKRFRHNQEIIEIREIFNNTLLQSKLEIQEQTLDHIAKELHANIGHLVSLVNINLSALLAEASDEMKESITETKTLTKQLLYEIKTLSATLNTDYLTKVGFINALDKELNRLATIKKYQISFTKKGQEYRLRPEHETILFRLCQEVLNNIVKYANAKSIKVSLNYSNELFELEIADDGNGFDVGLVAQQVAEKDSTGITNIKKRAEIIGGQISIKSQVGKGAVVSIIIPQPNK